MVSGGASSSPVRSMASTQSVEARVVEPFSGTPDSLLWSPPRLWVQVTARGVHTDDGTSDSALVRHLTAEIGLFGPLEHESAGCGPAVPPAHMMARNRSRR